MSQPAEKIYIEFIGPVGSGKSTIARRVKAEFEASGKKVVFHGEEQLRLLSKLPAWRKYTIPLIEFPRASFRAALFCIRCAPRLKTPLTKTADSRSAVGFFKRLVRDHFTFARYDFDFFIGEGLLSSVPFNNPGTNTECYDLLSQAYPGDIVYLVFVDTPPHIAQKRMLERGNSTSNFLARRYPENELKKRYRDGYEEINRVLAFIKAHRAGTGVFRIISVDGTKPTEENARYIADIILDTHKTPLTA